MMAHFMKTDRLPNAGEYAVRNGSPVLLRTSSDTESRGRVFSIDYVGKGGHGGGSSMWWEIRDFTVVRAPEHIILCQIHHARRMKSESESRAAHYQQTINSHEAALDALIAARRAQSCCGQMEN